MTLFRYAALGLLLAATPAGAQSLSDELRVFPLEERATAFPASGDLSAVAPVDSIFYDSGTPTFQFVFGRPFPMTNGSIDDPSETRAGRLVYYVTFTVPAARTTPFVATGIRATYRTSQVSAANSTPPRVQYDGEPPILDVFLGTSAPVPVVDSTFVQEGSIFQRAMPIITRTFTSTVDGYQVPDYGSPSISLVPQGQTTVPAQYVLQPGQSITVRVQHFNVPAPIAYKAGASAAANRTNFILQPAGYQTANSITYNPGGNDTQGVDAFDDLFGFIRLLSDDAFVTSGEAGAEDRALALGTSEPNPVRGLTSIPFALREAGAATISVYDALGRRVAVAAEGVFASGGQSVEFDASRLAPGVYAVVLEAAGQRATQRMSVVR